MTTSDQTLAEFKLKLLDDIAAMETCTDNSLILAWPYGLAVRIDIVPGGNRVKAAICSILAATAIREGSSHAYRRIENGAGEAAVLVRRQDALKRAIQSQKDVLGMLAANALG